MKNLLSVLSLLAAVLIVGITPADELPDPARVARHVAAFEGVWAGDDNITPFGPASMAFSFIRQADGSMHARSAQTPRTWIDIRFHEEEDGWKLTEAGAMDGFGVQRYTMSLARVDGEDFVWEVPGREGFMTVTTRADSGELHMEVQLRGQPHVKFLLQKLQGDEAQRLAALLAERAEASYAAEESR